MIEFQKLSYCTATRAATLHESWRHDAFVVFHFGAREALVAFHPPTHHQIAAHIDPNPSKDNLGIEPMPKIDFNIRTGNTLVGHATSDKVRRCTTTEKTEWPRCFCGTSGW